MEVIGNWVRNLLIIVLISTFLELFLPDNNLRKYVRVVMGFFIISLFISPLSLIIDQDFSTLPLAIPHNRMDERWEEIKEEGERLSETNQEVIHSHYNDRITARIKTVVNLNFPVAVVEVETELDKYYQPQGIEIQIDNSAQIKEVRIGDIENDRYEKEIEKKLRKVQTGISQVLQIPPDKINLSYSAGDDVIEDF